jgi:hypothetical protein
MEEPESVLEISLSLSFDHLARRIHHHHHPYSSHPHLDPHLDPVLAQSAALSVDGAEVKVFLNQVQCGHHQVRAGVDANLFSGLVDQEGVICELS